MQKPTVRVAGVALRGGEVLLHRRIGESVWALPGGRVEFGESASQALVRELREELACSAVCGGILFVVENFFPYEGAPLHEVGLYFQVSLEPDSAPLQAVAAFTGAEPELEFRWFERNSLGTAGLRPSFLVSALASPALEFQHVVEHQSAGI
jgi:ADP-ribose pyrophosphatase YjhB (NUDIX family)